MSTDGKKNTPVRLRTAGLPDEVIDAIRKGHYLVGDGADRLAVVPPKQVEAKVEARKTAAAGFAFDFGPTLAEAQPDVVYACKQFLIVKGRPTVFSGYAGSIKTWLALEMAVSVAAGLPTMWGGVPIQLSGVVRHFDYENLPELSARRFQRIAKGRGIDLAALGDRLGRVALPPIYLTSETAEGAFTRACEGVDLALIDSLRAACPSVEENDSTIREYLDRLTRVTRATGTIFVVLHHEGKSTEYEGAKRMRGSSALADAIDCSIGVKSCGDGVFEVAQGKHSWGAAGEPIRVRLVDEGEIDSSSDMSTAIRFEQVGADGKSGDEADPLHRAMSRIRQLLALSDGFDLQGPHAEVIVAVMSWAAKMERLATAERIAAARERIEAEGGRWGRPRRMGRAEIERATAMRAEGRTLRDIAVALRVPRSTIGRALAGVRKTPQRALDGDRSGGRDVRPC